MTWRPAFPEPPVKMIRLPPDAIVNLRLQRTALAIKVDGRESRGSMRDANKNDFETASFHPGIYPSSVPAAVDDLPFADSREIITSLLRARTFFSEVNKQAPQTLPSLCTQHHNISHYSYMEPSYLDHT